MEPARLLVTFFAVLFAVAPAVAVEEAATSCRPKNYAEFVSCVEGRSIDIQVFERQLQSAQKLEGVASQWINPEFGADSVWKGSEKSETTASLLFNIRLGGKKNALIAEARSEAQKAVATRDLGKQQVRLQIMLALYRLSHLESEIRIEEETIQTFGKIVGQFEGRPARSPEQETSLSVFRMAQADHKLRLTKLRADQEQIVRLMTAQTGFTREVIFGSLPKRREAWPDLPSAINSEQAPQIRQAASDLNIAKSLQARADGEAWPDLQIGPAFRSTKDGADSNSYVGVALAIPIPVFNRNEGGRAYRAQKTAEAELTLQQSKLRIQAEQNSLENRYVEQVRSLKNTLSIKSLVDKHEQLERQFFKGLVSSALVIEAHRQLFDFEQRRNESELEALEAYGQLSILNNSFDGVIL
ncbi:MAG TPA: TolC family protein [Pseudobdellovibrionaceae bacterium]|nr:TolC family protein [Pseudobdellovibrionaceae bacterium]